MITYKICLIKYLNCFSILRILKKYKNFFLQKLINYYQKYSNINININKCNKKNTVLLLKIYSLFLSCIIIKKVSISIVNNRLSLNFYKINNIKTTYKTSYTKFKRF